MGEIADRLITLRERISAAEVRYHRSPGSVKLVAVTKTQSVKTIIEAIQAGQTCFGENYVAEAIPKINALEHHNIEWHFIGAIQSNKTQAIVEHFDWVHSVSRSQIALRMNAQRSPHRDPLNVCIQVNVNNDPAKQGISLMQLTQLAETVAKLPHLQLRGLMTIPALNGHTDPLLPFRTLRLAQEYLQEIGLPLDTLSMGMSDDFEAAIAEGATIIRVGTAIFGTRERK